MKQHRFILSEASDALDGALEWLDAEIEKEEENDQLSRKVEEHVLPLVMQIAREQGLVATGERKA